MSSNSVVRQQVQCPGGGGFIGRVVSVFTIGMRQRFTKDVFHFSHIQNDVADSDFSLIEILGSKHRTNSLMNHFEAP